MFGSAIHERTQDTVPSPALVTVVESEACHFCADAHQALADLAATIRWWRPPSTSARKPGGLLMARHRATMSPLVLLDGAFFSNGRPPRRKLAKNLTQRYGIDAQGQQRWYGKYPSMWLDSGELLDVIRNRLDA